MAAKKDSRGGKREGAGRPVQGSARKIKRNHFLTPEQDRRLKILVNHTDKATLSTLVGKAIDEMFERWYLTQNVMCAVCGENESINGETCGDEKCLAHYCELGEHLVYKPIESYEEDHRRICPECIAQMDPT